MNFGTLDLKTNGGKRKMHYLEEEGVYYMTTPSDSKKITEIKQDNIVSISLDDLTYQAVILDSKEDMQKYGSLIKENLPGVMKFIVKFRNTSKNIIIKLEQV